MDVALLSTLRRMLPIQRPQQHMCVKPSTWKLLQHLGVSSKKADRDRRANGGKRRSDGKASPLVLIMGLCGAELPEASRGRGSTEALRIAILAVMAREPMRGLNRLLQGCSSSCMGASVVG